MLRHDRTGQGSRLRPENDADLPAPQSQRGNIEQDTRIDERSVAGIERRRSPADSHTGTNDKSRRRGGSCPATSHGRVRRSAGADQRSVPLDEKTPGREQRRARSFERSTIAQRQPACGSQHDIGRPQRVLRAVEHDGTGPHIHHGSAGHRPSQAADQQAARIP